MPAGDSAAHEASRQLALAAAHDKAAADARATASRYGVASATEQRTARALAPLAAAGYHLLADRQWPGSRRAQVDLVVVGPGGVFVVDTKAWADVSITEDRIHRGQEDVTDDLMALADLAYRTEGELAEVGLAPGEVHAVAVLAGRSGVDERVGPVRVLGERDVLRHIARRGSRLGPRQVDAVLARCLEWFRQVGDPAPVSTTLPEPVLPAPRGPVPVDEPEALLTEDEVQQVMLEGLMAAPVEEWMAFLHPAQARVVRRSYNGPARIRGAAGTGKTVVGLHRAAYLARTRQGKVLVTTYIRTLPDVLRQQLTRLAPDVVDRVEFAGVHETAKRILDERGVTHRIDGRQIAAAWTAAWGKVAGGSIIDTDRHEQDYWHDEVSCVIKGRGLTRWEQYADLPRLGRRHRLGPQQRRVVWDLYEAYQQELRARGVHDFADQISLAEAELRREPPAERYTAVVVDEAQDLTCVMIRMLHALVGDGPDGLTLVGDGQQTIYPGGFTLAEAGVSVAGRGVVLDVNYRNTREILQFASVLVRDDEFADIEGATARGDRPTEVARTGAKPVYVRCATEADRQRRLVLRVHEVVAEVGTNFGDVGVLSLSRRGVEAAIDSLTKAGVPVVNLEKYDGVPNNRVKVGTVKRAKGLEFKQVLVVDPYASWLSEKADRLDDVERERRDYRLRELYVAMTRARDGLWVAAI
ncbi:UvrD-helicase domain-containing protein [Cellulomonas wangsupingiae]|uniref:DNA 3'-5' helicase n=1 Tax=Cellulomonas wangsupingiae TaxID=2968085 RepID=A0ABY5K3A0_9CELL|nr:UvrD-helicase domain-containing protein [Cellulomonas wangsupingiae]MCC2333666.1 UvrD-helicase domain-containing protein [Cellulomonas wangsupingiae]UUI64932.1 UvrD-helicase domain-containing protein [Cellulomonas wangsupingiae]